MVRDKAEHLRAFSINIRTTGDTYGFLVPKNGDVVFKTAEPPYEGGKVGRGKECGKCKYYDKDILLILYKLAILLKSSW